MSYDPTFSSASAAAFAALTDASTTPSASAVAAAAAVPVAVAVAVATPSQGKEEDTSHDCSICAQHYTTVLRKKITCTFCHKHTCSKCVENYLLSRHEDAHCLHCRVNYSDVMLRSICTPTYLKQKYFKHRQEVLINRERSMLPGLQDVALARKKEREQLKDIHAAHKIILEIKCDRVTTSNLYFTLRDTYEHLPLSQTEERATLRQQMDEALIKMDHLSDMIGLRRREYYEMRWRLRHPADAEEDDHVPQAAVAAETDPKPEKKTFVRRCLRDSCQGFLSTAWKCGLCEWYSCATCLTVRGEHRDAPHECKKEDVETAEMIRKDSKPCPNCGQYIQKTSGCFAKNTPVCLWDGNVIWSQDVREGHVLMGDDGTPRTVQAIVTGEDMMYEVTQASGMTYMVNSKHTLVLTYEDSSGQEGRAVMDPIELIVENVMKLSLPVQGALRGFKGSAHGHVRTALTIRPMGRGTYYGWRLDGNHRFLLADGTVVRNCSQMFCISCQTPFDWVTGKVVTSGVLHNPHYFEWIQRTQGAIPRNPRDIPCGGYPAEWELYRYRPTLNRNQRSMMHFHEFYRICMEIQDVGGRTYRSHMDQDAVQNLHVRFLLGEMTEVQWGRRLATLEKKRKRDMEIQEVFAAYHMVAVDMIQRLYLFRRADGTPMSSAEITQALDQWEKELDGFLDMINDAFARISRAYCYATPMICWDLETHGKVMHRRYWLKTHNVSKVKRAVFADSDSDSDSDAHADDEKEEEATRAGPMRPMLCYLLERQNESKVKRAVMADSDSDANDEKEEATRAGPMGRRIRSMDDSGSDHSDMDNEGLQEALRASMVEARSAPTPSVEARSAPTPLSNAVISLLR